jgi:hypothetical protein
MYSTKLPVGRHTMSNIEARQRQQTMRNRQKTARAARYLQNNNNISREPAYPVNIHSWALEVGNANVKSKAAAARANYNIFDRSRHAALWKHEFGGKTRKRKHRGGVDEKVAYDVPFSGPKPAEGPALSELRSERVLREITSVPSFRTATPQQRYHILKNFLKAKKADLATIPEYSALLQLILMKYGISPDINTSNYN